MEIRANEAFDVYRELYYEGGVSSVYFWNLDDGFAGVVLLKKGNNDISRCFLSDHIWYIERWPFIMEANSRFIVAPSSSNSAGSWDSIHVFEAVDRARTAHYKLTSTVILSLSTNGNELGEMDLSGNMTRQIEADLPIQDDAEHIANIGRLVEDMELKMRNLLQEVYFGKAKDVVGDLRSLGSLSEGAKERKVRGEMLDAMKR